MPFKSKRQLATCFSRELSAKSKGEKWTWNCEKWLKETPRPECLPSLKGSKRKPCRQLKKGERIIGPVKTGSRGGKYFTVSGINIYIPKGSLQYAIKKYGVN